MSTDSVLKSSLVLSPVSDINFPETIVTLGKLLIFSVLQYHLALKRKAAGGVCTYVLGYDESTLSIVPFTWQMPRMVLMSIFLLLCIALASG